MAIHLCENNIFVLETKNTHYVIGVDRYGHNRHLHWGKKCDINDYFIEYIGDENSNHTMLDDYHQEYTPFGGTMYRDCTVKAEFSDKCREISLKYDGYMLDGNTLSLTFSDKVYPLEIILNYKAGDDDDIITRWTTLKNNGSDKIRFEKLFSAEYNLPSKKPYTFKNTNGAWGGEFLETNSVLEGGSMVFESRRGTSGHNQSPYFIAYQNADEKSGDVYFATLAYSGSFKVSASRDLFRTTRVILGMNDFDFAFELLGGESFETPEVYSGYVQGFGEMSRQMNKFAIKNILPKSFNKKTLPVLYNSWEATEFNVNVQNQIGLAERAAEMGVELFVMDDGWFGKRNNDRAGLGDWFVNREKFPNGLDELINRVNELGMDFGIWVEPEMVNADSDLFRAHPDWAYHYDTRTASELRHQLVLNMTRKDVQEYIFGVLDDLLSNHNIKYVKWDMNRPLSETGAENLPCPQMLWYLHTKAVYDIVDKLKAKHPETAFESCSSGGGRSDLGALTHFDQAWTSDNTDAVDRMVIQKGYSLIRPIKTMRAWVTDIAWIIKPATLDFRFNIAMQGSLGIGGNLLKYSDEDLETCKKYISLYKEIRDLVQFGDLYRIMDIDKDEISVNQYVNGEKTESVVFIAANGTRFYKKKVPLIFDGLDENRRYTLTIGGKQYEKSGAYLMNVGIDIMVRGAYYNEIVRIHSV
ncbi:MAG: alpha-galactosidase [Oscillospiraceae bacterium]|nr:alpha-galactosidase [Oscillospiraceae bacterium]